MASRLTACFAALVLLLPSLAGAKSTGEPGRDKRAGCGAAHDADAGRGRHIGTHQNSGQDEQPDQLVAVRCADFGTDQEAARPEYHTRRDQGRTKRTPP